MLEKIIKIKKRNKKIISKFALNSNFFKFGKNNKMIIDVIKFTKKEPSINEVGTKKIINKGKFF